MNPVLAAVGCLARYRRDGGTLKGARMAWAMLGWAVVAIFPTLGHAADSLLDATLKDTELYFTAPLRWDEEDWMYFGGALVAIGAAHSFDTRVRDHFATGSNVVLNGGGEKNRFRGAA